MSDLGVRFRCVCKPIESEGAGARDPHGLGEGQSDSGGKHLWWWRGASVNMGDNRGVSMALVESA